MELKLEMAYLYKKADPKERLSMFMEFPCYRILFEDIERQESPPMVEENKKAKKRKRFMSLFRIWGHPLKSCGQHK